ncbi:MAG: GyrI-like domain-containing protein [Granulosicoccus sp.]
MTKWCPNETKSRTPQRNRWLNRCQLPNQLVSRTTPACRALKAFHTGPYLHLANAWAMLMGEARYKKLKGLKSIPPFEIYLNDPDTTAPSELITERYLPLK